MDNALYYDVGEHRSYLLILMKYLPFCSFKENGEGICQKKKRQRRGERVPRKRLEKGYKKKFECIHVRVHVEIVCMCMKVMYPGG